jgi:predicted deacetylase
MPALKVSLPIKKVGFYKGVFFTATFLIGLSLISCMPKHSGEKHINIIFRFDDYSAISSAEFEMKIINALRENNITATFAVIPFECAIDQLDTSRQDLVPLTVAKADILKNSIADGIIEVALHGYSHQTISSKQRTEFSGLDFKSQLDRLSKGKKYLEDMIGIPIQIFVPPFNQYDKNTLLALEELNFTTISAYKGGPIACDSRLTFIPATCSLNKLRDAIKAARNSSDTGPVIVVLFHDYDFHEIDEKFGFISYPEFCDLLCWLKSQEDLRLMSISQATGIINNLNAGRFMSDKWSGRLSHLLPLLLQREEYLSGYMESGDLIKIILKVVVFYLAIISLGIVGSLIIGYFVFPRSAFMMKFGSVIFLAMSIISLIYAIFNLQAVHHGLIASSAFIGGSVGYLYVFYISKKKSRL